MKYIYELTRTNKIKKHKVQESVKIGGIDVIKVGLLGILVFKKSIIKLNDSYLFKGFSPLKGFLENLSDRNIESLVLEINLTEQNLKNLKKNLSDALKRKQEGNDFITSEKELIKNQYEKNI